MSTATAATNGKTRIARRLRCFATEQHRPGRKANCMDFITKLRTMRAIERAASKYGYSADATVDHRTLPDCGTYWQQLDIAAIGLDCGIRLGELSTREREFVGRLIRNCVLSGQKHSQPQAATASRPARRRAW